MLRSKRPQQSRPKGGLLVGRRNTRPREANVITAEDLFNIAFGFGISASGGGGSFMQGLEIARKSVADNFHSVELFEPSQLTGSGKAFVSGGIGKPESLTDPIAFGEKVLVLLENIDTYLRKSSSSLKGILPVEAGPINGLLPIYNVHAYNKKHTLPDHQIQLFDCDGAGRAVPALTTLMYDYFERGTCPMTYNFQNDAKETRNVLLQSPDVLNGSDAEQVFSSVMLYGDGTMNESIPFTCWEFDEDMAKAGINFPTGTYSYWKVFGRKFKEAYKDKDKMIAFLQELNDINYYSTDVFSPHVYSSTVSKVVQVPNDRWNVGYITFDIKPGVSENRLYFVNENLTISKLTYEGNKLETIATAPSSITTFFKDPSPDAVQIDTTGGVLESGYIPYNTGDIAKIQDLEGVDIIIAVTDPTIPGKMNFLCEEDMRSRFLAVMNDTFKLLNDENSEEIFPDVIEEVTPLPALKVPN